MVPALLTSVFGVQLPTFATVAAWEREERAHPPFWLETYRYLQDWGRTVAPLGPETYGPSEQLVLAYADIVDKLPAHVILFEGLRRKDDQKPRTWPLRVAELRARYRCDATLVVFCTDEEHETWASRTVHTGQPNWDFRPLVLGSSTIPVVTSREVAMHNPPLAVLSAMRHARDPEHGEEVFLSALQGLRVLGEDRFGLYLNRLLAACDEKVASHMKGLLLTDPRIEDFYGTFARSYKMFGQADGVKEGKAIALLRVLHARDIDVPEKTRQAILRCRSSEKLETWVTQAATATGLYEIFDGEALPD